jgi:hypothetical protein
MNLLFFLSKEDISIAKAEIDSLIFPALRKRVGSDSILIDNLYIVNTRKDISGRLSYTSKIYRFFFICKIDSF